MGSIALAVSHGQAAPDLNFKYQETPAVRTELKKKKKPKTESKLSVIVPSFVIHGMTPGNEAAASMPRRMDESGRTVVTPGAGLEYKGENGFLIMGAFVKDCYDNPAGTFQIGEQWDLAERFSLGLTMGVYVRQTPLSCDTTGWGPYQRTDCHTMDNLDWKFMTSINGVPVDIIPMPFLHLTVAMIKTQEFQLDLKVMSNYFLNEVGIGVPF